MNPVYDKDSSLESLIDNICGLYEEFTSHSKDSINSLYDDCYDFTNSFNRWKQYANRFLHVYYKDDIAITEFNRITKLKVSKESLSELIGLFESLQQYPKCIETTKNGFAPILQINNDLTQNLSLNIKNIIEQELNQQQINELYETIRSNISNEEKKKSLLKSLCGFGENVAASLFASILANM